MAMLHQVNNTFVTGISRIWWECSYEEYPDIMSVALKKVSEVYLILNSNVGHPTGKNLNLRRLQLKRRSSGFVNKDFYICLFILIVHFFYLRIFSVQANVFINKYLDTILEQFYAIIGVLKPVLQWWANIMTLTTYAYSPVGYLPAV